MAAPSDATLQAGGYTVRTLVDARFALDGGSMFGVVPKALWQRATSADERNRIPMVTRLLLLEGHGRRVLVDTGLGDRWSDKERDIFAIDTPGGGVRGWLEDHGPGADAITDVILTHLHFDHAAGTVDAEGALAFPHATHHVQRRQWEWAASPTLKDAASFRGDDVAPLRRPDAPLNLLDGPAEPVPGIRVEPLDGHTAGMQAVVVGDGDGRLFFPSDLVPTAAHVRLPWIMGYDNEPLRTLREKQRWLHDAARGDWVVVLQHDPETAAVRLRWSDRGPEVRERIDL